MRRSGWGMLAAAVLVAATASAAHTTLEAEDATLNGVTLRDHTEASGGYRVVQFDATGDYISYDSAPAGSYLYLTYSLGLDTAKQCSVYIDGTDLTTATFYPTGDWGVYKPLLIEMPVTGPVRLQLDADDQAFNADESCASQDKIEIMDELTTALAGLATIGQRYREVLMDYSFWAAEDYMTSMDPGGYWDDIDYGTTEVPYTHISRCFYMLRTYNKVGHAYYESPLMLDAARRSFHYWMQEDWQDWNWWDNQIGVTLDAAEIMLIGRGQLWRHDWTKGIEVLGRAWPASNPNLATGQNLIYRVHQTILRGVIEDDPAVTYEIMQEAADEIVQPADEGIQVDWAFHQHGPQLYWGGYGLGFSSDIATIAQRVADTPFSLAPAKLHLVTGLVLDGQQWAIRGHALDPGVMGRSISRKSASTNGSSFAAICDRLVASNDPRLAELENMAKNIRGEAGAVPLSGNRHFFTSDFMAHHRAAFYTSFKMASSRIYGTESGNDEGLKNYHLPDGAAWLYRRGDEYDNIYPVLEWRRIPGITCEQYTESIPLCNWGANSWSDTTWAGGASDGTFGAATFHLKRLDVEALKAGFYFDDCFVLLGADVACAGNQPVYTSINQCILNGDATLDDGTGPSLVATGEHHYTDPKWIHHDGVGYVPLAPAEITVKADAQSGNWYDINHSYSTDAVTEDVFSAWVDHGTQPSAGSYAYAVLPDFDTAATSAWADAPPVEILSNTNALQAVRHDAQGVVGAVFFTTGSLEIENGLTVTVDQPCVAVMRYGDHGFGAAVANPDAQARTVTMTVTHDWAGQGVEWSETRQTTILTFDLPGGDYGGASVVKAYAPAGFTIEQRVALSTDGQLWAGAFNLTTAEWGNTVIATEDTTLAFSAMDDQWVGIFLYDYAAAAYVEGMYAYRQAWW